MKRFRSIIGMALLIPAAALAQAPQITTLWPPGGMRGGQVQTRIEGANFTGATAILCSGGLTITRAGAGDNNAIPVTVTSDAKAGPGPYEVRVVTPKGISNPGYVFLGAWPEIVEKEPNSKLEEPMALDKLPVTVNGRTDGGEDIDWFSFTLNEGQTFVAEICANRIASALDPFMELRDPKGRLVATAMEGYDRDPRLVHTTKLAGTYKLLVRDTLYRGGPNYVYRLTIGAIPLVTQLDPPFAPVGSSQNYAVQGHNLMGFKEWTNTIPVDRPADKPVWVFVDTPAGPSLPVWLAPHRLIPIYAPSTGASVSLAGVTAYPGTPPTLISGRFTERKQTYIVPLTAQAGKPVILRALGRDIGGRYYPMVRIYNPSGVEVFNNEETAGRDVRTTFNPPLTGVFKVELTSADNHFGPDHIFRFYVWPSGSQSEVSAFISPDVATLGRGQAAIFTVQLDRRGDWDGEVNIKVDGLPKGVTASPLSLGVGQSTGYLSLTAASDATVNASAIVFSATGVKGSVSGPVSLLVSGSYPRPGEGNPASRSVAFTGVATNESVPLFAFAPEMTRVALKRGTSVSFKMRVTRKPGDAAANPAIALTLSNLPPGVTAETPAIPEKQGEVTIKLNCSADAPLRQQNALLNGKIGDNTQPGPVITIDVVK